MSTVAYLHRIRKDDFFSWGEQVRGYYREHGLLGRLAHELARQIVAETDIDKATDMLTGWHTATREHADYLESLTVDFQLFDEGDTWLVRTLERGRGGGHFTEIVAQHPDWPVENVYYNDSTDMPEGMEKLRPVMTWLDQQIDDGRWLLYRVITVSDADRIIHDIVRTRRRERAQDTAVAEPQPDTSGPAPAADRWQCNDCSYWATLIENAHNHAHRTEHTLRPVGDADGVHGATAGGYAGVRAYITGESRD